MMQLGMLGLGRMGANLARRLMKGGHDCVVYDANASLIVDLEKEGASGALNLDEFVGKLTAPRIVWIMVPAAAVGPVIGELKGRMQQGDIVIDGGNSYYKDDIARARELGKLGIHFVDVGTSGGVWGLERGYCLMIGGENDVVGMLDPVFRTLAPGSGEIERTAVRSGEPSTSELGYLH